MNTTDINAPQPTDTPLDKHAEQVSQYQEQTETSASRTEGDDYIASPEEVAAFLRDRRQQKEQQKRHPNASSTEAQETDQQEKGQEVPTNPYMEPDPYVPKVVYKDSPFLWRGCKGELSSYEPISNPERCSCSKLAVYNWMNDIHSPVQTDFDCVEVRFKSNRKEFFRLPFGISVTEGDVVAVDGTPGHDVGIVSLTGELCRVQMRKKKTDPKSESIKKLFRRAKVSDLEKWAEAIKLEESTLIKARQITEELGLVMKMNDVEYQGDRSKAIFYYTADDRVDFRALIRVLAEEFHVRVEMKQIGVRQESGKVGGLGTCGRELCCSTWLTNFKSVTTSAAKAQQILPNPQKLAGQCGKLKCCLNFEYEVYVDAMKKFPPTHVALRFKKGLALYKKIDIFRGIMWYAYEGQNDLYAIPADSVKEIIEKNRRQEYPEQLEQYQVELMSSGALVQETSDSEFEQALRQLADNGSEIISEEDTTLHDNRSRGNNDPRGERRNDRERRRDDWGSQSNRHSRNNDNRRDNGNLRRDDRNEARNNDRNRSPRRRGEGAPSHRNTQENPNRNKRNNGNTPVNRSTPKSQGNPPHNSNKPQE